MEYQSGLTLSNVTDSRASRRSMIGFKKSSQSQKWSFFELNFSDIIFGTASSRQWNPIFGQHRRPKLASGFGLPHNVRGVQNEQKTASSPAAQAASAQYCYVPNPLAHAAGNTTNRCNRILMVSTARALPLSSQSRLRHAPSSTTTCLVEDKGSRCLGESK